MEIDARIPLGVVVPEAPSALDSYGRAMQIKNMIDLGREREARLRKAEREEQMERARMRVFNRHRKPDGSVNHRGALHDMWEVDPDFARQYSVQVENMEKAERVDAEAKRKTDQEKRERFAASLYGVKGGEDIQGVVTNAVAQGDMTAEEAVRWRRMSMLPFDEQLRIVNDMRMRVLGVDKQEQERRAVENDARLRAQEARAAKDQALQEEKHNWEIRQLQGNLNKTLQDVYGTAPMTAAQKSTQQHQQTTEAIQQGNQDLRRQALRQADLRRTEEREAKLADEIVGLRRQLSSSDLTAAQRVEINDLLQRRTNELASLRQYKVDQRYSKPEDIAPRVSPPPPKPSSWRDWLPSFGGFGQPKAAAPAAPPASAPPKGAPPKAQPAPTSGLPDFDRDYSEGELESAGKAGGLTRAQIDQLKAAYLAKRKFKTTGAAKPARKPEKLGTARTPQSAWERMQGAWGGQGSTLGGFARMLAGEEDDEI